MTNLAHHEKRFANDDKPLVEYKQVKRMNILDETLLGAKGQAFTAADLAQGTQSHEHELLHRLLRDVDDEMGVAIRALAACRAFSYPV